MTNSTSSSTRCRRLLSKVPRVWARPACPAMRQDSASARRSRELAAAQADPARLLEGEGATAFPRQDTLLGTLFESITTSSVQVYAARNETKLRHLRTARGRQEIDLIVERADGKVVAVEVKLGGTSPATTSSTSTGWRTSLGTVSSTGSSSRPGLVHTVAGTASLSSRSCSLDRSWEKMLIVVAVRPCNVHAVPRDACRWSCRSSDARSMSTPQVAGSPARARSSGG